MAIKKYYVEQRPRSGLPFDRKAKKYFSWGYDIRVDGVRLQERGFLTKAQAEAAVQQLQANSKNARHGIRRKERSPYLFDVLQTHLDSLTGKERVRAKRVFTYFYSLLPKGIRALELRRADLQRFIDARQKDLAARTKTPISPQTIHRELVPIIRAFNKAGDRFPELEDWRPPSVEKPKIPKSRKERVISLDEQARLLKYFYAGRKKGEDRRRHEFRVRTGQFFEFCLRTLARSGEIASLRRFDVDFDRGTVSITGTKTRYTASQTVRTLAITPRMAEILKARVEEMEGTDKEFIFTDGGYVTSKMRDQLKAACIACRIKYGQAHDAVSFHTTRHTGITMLLQAGIDLKTVGAMAGHSDAKMTMYYTHINPELIRDAGFVLERNMAKMEAKSGRLGEK